MADQPKREQPEIMPPVPDVEPRRGGVEIPADKDAPEKNRPTKGEK